MHARACVTSAYNACMRGCPGCAQTWLVCLCACWETLRCTRMHAHACVTSGCQAVHARVPAWCSNIAAMLVCMLRSAQLHMHACVCLRDQWWLTRACVCACLVLRSTCVHACALGHVCAVVTCGCRCVHVYVSACFRHCLSEARHVGERINAHACA
jgi:hypothetical protein